jgi:hypothetical protein
MGASCEPACGSRSVVRSTCVPQSSGATSKRGARVASWPRHHASISAMSFAIAGPTTAVRSLPSLGKA